MYIFICSVYCVIVFVRVTSVMCTLLHECVYSVLRFFFFMQLCCVCVCVCGIEMQVSVHLQA